ncbi:hypothetical protein ACFULT_26305 [Rhodococcus sp. NPDC057297]|uniref:hypothetical protein n=1 Tax=Rhodococcus sp. NPDC057297 TaxID=3346090 RepID=UPI00362C2EDD
MDLLDFFRGRRPWGQFYRFVKHLPQDGKFKAAQAADPELARAIADSPKKDRPPLPTTEGYDLPTRVQIATFNMLKVLDWHLLRVNGNKTPRPQLWTVPATALDRELSFRSKTTVDRVLAELGVKN